MPIVFIHFGWSHVTPANAALPSCFLILYAAQSQAFRVLRGCYGNHTEGQSRGEEGEMLTHKW